MTDTNELKVALETELKNITGELESLGIQQPIDGDWVATPEDVERNEADPNVVADRNEDWAERRSTLAALETRFNNIKRALQKITDGTFGTCEVCGEAIAADRLAANPAARTCSEHMNEEGSLTN